MVGGGDGVVVSMLGLFYFLTDISVVEKEHGKNRVSPCTNRQMDREERT